MIGIIGAMASEVDGLKEIMEDVKIANISSVDFYLGRINNVYVVVAKAGVGKVNAALTTEIMILKYNVSKIINVGVAGGLEPTLKIGDVVIGDSVVEHDMDTTPLGDEPGFITGLDCVYMDCDKELSDLLYQCTQTMGFHTLRGVIASGDVFVASDDIRNRIIKQFNGVAAEMEGAAIGHACVMNNVPFTVLRTISDCANDDSKVDFGEFVTESSKNAIEIINLLLKKMGE